MIRTRTLLSIALLCAVLSPTGWAQQPPNGAFPQEAAPPRLDPKACRDRERATTGAGPTMQVPQSEEPPGERLARTDGVICPPPDIDPEIRAPAPGGGTTPVIPPPGSPGGDPSVQPK